MLQCFFRPSASHSTYLFFEEAGEGGEIFAGLLIYF
jgi:hypothetical protein